MNHKQDYPLIKRHNSTIVYYIYRRSESVLLAYIIYGDSNGCNVCIYSFYCINTPVDKPQLIYTWSIRYIKYINVKVFKKKLNKAMGESEGKKTNV